MLTKESAARKDQTTGKGAVLQHRHYAYIAAIIQDIAPVQRRDQVALHFADQLRYSNPKFDRARLLAACGNVEDRQ